MTRSLAVIAAAFMADVAAPATGAEAQHGQSAITCMNKSSGATWQIEVDYDRNTVDSNPARISESWISWRDAKDGWNYSLDRKSGDLTVILASSTGGNTLLDRCKLSD